MWRKHPVINQLAYLSAAVWRINRQRSGNAENRRSSSIGETLAKMTKIEEAKAIAYQYGGGAHHAAAGYREIAGEAGQYRLAAAEISGESSLENRGVSG
jgi:oligoribonuclease NrnB/cAMP/cGMP phosphodiesterase (DHH superfamily)